MLSRSLAHPRPRAPGLRRTRQRKRPTAHTASNVEVGSMMGRVVPARRPACAQPPARQTDRPAGCPTGPNRAHNSILRRLRPAAAAIRIHHMPSIHPGDCGVSGATGVWGAARSAPRRGWETPQRRGRRAGPPRGAQMRRGRRTPKSPIDRCVRRYGLLRPCSSSSMLQPPTARARCDPPAQSQRETAQSRPRPQRFPHVAFGQQARGDAAPT